MPFSHPSYSVPSKAAEAGADQRLPTDGGGVHQEPGADEASGGETGGQSLLHTVCASLGFALDISVDTTNLFFHLVLVFFVFFFEYFFFFLLNFGHITE